MLRNLMPKSLLVAIGACASYLQAAAGHAQEEVSVDKGGEQQANSEELQEVIVTGSRIPTPAGQQVQPVRTYTSQNIEQSGQTSVVDFLNTLPDVSTSLTEGGYQTFAGQTTVTLHGLPIGTTLVLLNGQRLEISAQGFFDLTSIPVAAVERIEVLPTGASAVYGADALGGAVNILLRKEVNGLEVDVNLGHAADLSDRSVSVAWGTSWDRAAITVLGTYQSRGGLLGDDRTPTSTTDFPATALPLYATDNCSPGNVYSLNGQNLPGLTSPQAAIPAGISGIATIQQLAAGAGKTNTCNIYLAESLIPATQREGVLVTGHYQIGARADLFTEILFSHWDQTQYAGPVVSASGGSTGEFTVGVNNPYNPFHETVGISFNYPGLLQAYDVGGTVIRPLVGLRGSLGSDWQYQATAFFSADHFHADAVFSDPNAQQAALNSADPATALNPFTTGPPGTPQLLQSLLTAAAGYDNEPNTQRDQLANGQLVLRGPLLRLPAGSLDAVLGSEVGHEKLFYANPFSATLDLQRTTYAFFSEARIPLVAAGVSSPGARLAVTVAGRYDHSNDYGGKATWQAGLLWHPAAALVLRGNYGTSYRAPQLQEIAGPPEVVSYGAGALVDPLRPGDTSFAPQVVFGPNPSLKPETGSSRTLGIAYSSEAWRGLAATVDYFAIDIKNYIGIQTPQVLIDNPALFPGAVVRGPPTALDQELGQPGQIVQVNSIEYNFGDLHVAGFDADLRYVMNTRAGTVTPSLAVTNIYKWQSALLPGQPLMDDVSQAGGNPGWAPRWKGTVALTWAYRGWSTITTGRYVGRYQDYQYVVPNSNVLGNFWVCDFNVRYEAGPLPGASGLWAAGSYISLGAVNLFDKALPLSFGGIPYDPAEYDIRGRFVYVRLGAKW